MEKYGAHYIICTFSEIIFLSITSVYKTLQHWRTMTGAVELAFGLSAPSRWREIVYTFMNNSSVSERGGRGGGR